MRCEFGIEHCKYEHDPFKCNISVTEVGKTISDEITVPDRLKTSLSWITDSAFEIKLKKSSHHGKYPMISLAASKHIFVACYSYDEEHSFAQTFIQTHV